MLVGRFFECHRVYPGKFAIERRQLTVITDQGFDPADIHGITIVGRLPRAGVRIFAFAGSFILLA